MDPPARLTVRLFGAAEMTFDGEPWSVWMPPRCMLLLALVAGRLDEAPSRASLAAALWPDELDSDARTNLRRHLHVLQHGLPQIEGVDWIAYEGKNLRWNDRAPVWADVREFQRLSDDPERAAEAAEIYRGSLLAALFDESILAERERLDALHRELLLRLVREARERRDPATAVRYAQKLLAVDEWREDALREWMIGTAQSGDRAGALEAFEGFAKRLQDEFSTAPTQETTALRDAIRSDLPLPGVAPEHFENALSEPARRAWNLPFVGRDDELTRLRSIWTRAARGNGGTAFVSGEAGIGKSRIVAEMAALALEQGAYVLRGRTSEPETSPYQAVLEALRAGLAHLIQLPPQTPWLGVLARVLPEIASLLPGTARDDDLGSDRARERLFDAVAAAIAHLARMRPLCIVLEDLQWAGPASVDLVEAVARRIGALPVMLLVTYRSEDSTSGHPLRSLRARLVRERRAAAIPLERLGSGDVAKIVGAVVQRTADRELDEPIARLSEGNPLFVAQLLEGYRETGALPDEASALRSARDAIAARVERFDPEIRSIAAAAAVAGQPFRSDVVAEIGEWSESAVLDAFGALMDRSLVSEAGEGPAYAFTHALVGAAFYGGLDAEMRVRWHRRAAGVLQRVRPGDGTAHGEIARHYELGGRRQQAAATYVLAARAAGEILAREEAERAAQRAYALAADEQTRFDAMEAATSILGGTTNLERWRVNLELLERSAATLGDEEQFVAMRIRERLAAQIVDFEMQLQVVEALESLAGRSGVLRHLAYARFARGYYSMQSGDLEAARAGFSRSLETAMLAQNPQEAARAREELIAILMRCGDWERARAETLLQRELVAAHAMPVARVIALLSIETSFAAIAEDGPRLEKSARELLEVATRIGDTYNVAKAHMLLTQSAALLCDLVAMREHHAVATELFDRLGEARAAAIAALNRAFMELRAGRTDLALRQLDDERALFERLAAPDTLSLVALCRAEALLLAESFEEALALARETFEAVSAIGEPRHVAEVATVLGAAEGRCGRYEDAVAHLRAAIAGSRECEAHHQTAYAASWLIDVCCDAARPGDAQAVAAELQAIFEEKRELVGYPTFACRALARIRSSNSGAESRRWSETGLAILRERLGLFQDAADAEAFARLFFNRELLAGST